KEWNWQAMAHAVNTRWQLKTNDRDLKKIGRDNLAQWLTGQAEKSVAEVDLSKGADYLQPDWGVKSFCRWAKDKFQITLNPTDLVEKPAVQIREHLRKEIRKLYRQKEIEFPVTLGMVRFMADREHSGPGSQRYDREGLYKWAAHRFGKKVERPAEERNGAPPGPDNGGAPRVAPAAAAAPAYPPTHVALPEDAFRTNPRAKTNEMLLDPSRKLYPAAGHDEIDARLDESF